TAQDEREHGGRGGQRLVAKLGSHDSSSHLKGSAWLCAVVRDAESRGETAQGFELRPNLEREWGLGEAGDGDGLDVAYSCSAMAPRRSSMAICMRSRWVRNESTQMRIRNRPRTVVL